MALARSLSQPSLIQGKHLCLPSSSLRVFSDLHPDFLFFLLLFLSVLLVSSPTMPQLGTMLSPASIQTPPSSQATARVVSHSSSAGLPQVRVVAQPSLPAVSQQSVGPAQPLPQMPAGPQIRVPVTATQTKVVPQVNGCCMPLGYRAMWA